MSTWYRSTFFPLYGCALFISLYPYRSTYLRIMDVHCLFPFCVSKTFASQFAVYRVRVRKVSCMPLRKCKKCTRKQTAVHPIENVLGTFIWYVRSVQAHMQTLQGSQVLFRRVSNTGLDIFTFLSNMQACMQNVGWEMAQMFAAVVYSSSVYPMHVCEPCVLCFSLNTGQAHGQTSLTLCIPLTYMGKLRWLCVFHWLIWANFADSVYSTEMCELFDTTPN